MSDHRPARVLVTGGAGFIGSHLVERLVERGDAVTVVDDLRNAALGNLAAVRDSIVFVEGDCVTAARLIEGADVVFHLAAPAYVPPSVEDPIGDLRNNVEQTLVLLDAIRRESDKPRLVHVSSAAVYGEPEQQPISEDFPPRPISPYGVDKFAAEEHVRVAAHIHGIEAIILRYFPVYGPRQRKQVVYDLLQKVMQNPERIEVFGTGRELRDMVYVDDVVEATLIAAERAPAEGEAYNVGAGSMVSIEQVAHAAARALGAEPEIVFTGSVRAGDSSRMCADVSKLRSLGYEPKVALDEGFARTAAWLTAVAREEVA